MDDRRTEIQVRGLGPRDVAALHRTFLAAFSDYPVAMAPSFEEFDSLLAARGASLPHTYGATAGDRIVAFWIIAIGDVGGEPGAYVISTGVVPEFRRRGLATRLFETVRERLRLDGRRRCRLEVLVRNERALPAYRRLGFIVRRELVCLRFPTHDGILARRRPASVEVTPVSIADWRSWGAMGEVEPTWQNSAATIDRAGSGVAMFAARVAGRAVGYAVVGRRSGDLHQIGVSRDARRRGVGTALVQAVAAALDSPRTLRVINLDARADAGFYHALGAEEFVRQYEMEWSDSGA